MSVINQVLSDLEKRGAGALPGGPSIRAVPVPQNRLKPLLLAAAILVLALVAAMLWRSGTQPGPAAPRAERTPHGSRAIPETAVSAPGAASAPVTPVAPHRAESPPVAVAATQEVVREANGLQKNAAEPAAPPMRMSFELHSIPLPSSLRAQPPAPADRQRSGSGATASPPTPVAPAGGRAKTASPQQKVSGATKGKMPGDAPAPAAPAGGVDKQVRQLSAQQQADNEFRKANGWLQQGRSGEALAGYETALRLDAGHDAARQALAGLLLENRRGADAERVLQDGLEYNPKHGGFAMLLARLLVERDALQPALETLLKTLPHAGQQADYQAFVAALQQRLNRHPEAVTHYRIALQLAPDSGVWLMGLGISLQALRRNEEARDAFKRALESRVLSAELQAFVRQRLKEL
ncbi:MAG: tetratricopeptide repeat protein [Nitrosomonadales bacterium]|nr:tetratricopeptide repeat protein [Nitrosomonadales bacterium]